MCKEKVEWDACIPEVISDKWRDFILCVKLIDIIKIPRCVFNTYEQDTSLQLHGFSDSSQVAYCAVIYVRREHGVTVDLLTAKTKVAPLKKLTIPKLELLACVLLTKLMSSVVRALKRKYKEFKEFRNCAFVDKRHS